MILLVSTYALQGSLASSAGLLVAFGGSTYVTYASAIALKELAKPAAAGAYPPHHRRIVPDARISNLGSESSISIRAIETMMSRRSMGRKGDYTFLCILWGHFEGICRPVGDGWSSLSLIARSSQSLSTKVVCLSKRIFSSTIT